METVKAKIKGTNAILEGCICDDSFFVPVDHDIFERYALCEVEICKDSLQVSESCKENTDSFTSLEEAAEEYAYRGIPDEIKQDVKPIADEIIKQFIAGAKWQKEQYHFFNKAWAENMQAELDRNYENGKQAMKEQMMKDAVEAEITVVCLPDDWSLAYNPDELHRALLKFKSGGKVKIIIVKQ